MTRAEIFIHQTRTIWSSLGMRGYLPFHDTLVLRVTWAYLMRFRQKCRDNGKVWTCNRYKLLHLAAVRIATLDALPDTPYNRRSASGVPVELLPLVPLLRSAHCNVVRVALTTTRVYECIVLPPVLDLEPITDPGQELEEVLVEKLSSFFYVGTQRLHIWNIRPPSPDKVLGNLVKGPNGPSILTSHYDAKAVCADHVLHKALRSLASLTGGQGIVDLMEYMATHTPDDSYLHSRISLLSQGGGKTRVIAIGDYGSQNVLRGIHDKIMGVLRRLQTDGTYGQEAQVGRILRESKGRPCYSFDLSSATDRFPVRIQVALLRHVFGKDIADAGRDVMINRGFHTTTGAVRGARGQPLGMLSSGAVFALTHHAIIEYCAHLVGFKSFKEYAVLGDDVVIGNTSVAARYQSLMEQIGVKINLNKSMIGSESVHRVEFAKRILFNGQEITGLKPDIIIESSRSIYNLMDLVRVARSRSGDLPWSVFWAPSVSEKLTELLACLSWESACREIHKLNPEADLAPMPPVLRGHIGHEVTITDLGRKVKEVRIELLRDKQASLDKILSGGKTLEELFKREGVVHTEALIGNYAFPHPIVWALNQTGELLVEALSVLGEPLDDEMCEVCPIEYLPLPDKAVYFGDRHRLRSAVRSSIVLKAWFRLKAELR